MPGLSRELTGTCGSMNPRQSVAKHPYPEILDIQRSQIGVTWVQLVLTGIFQLIITEMEPSLLCCFVPSSESKQEPAQPHTNGGSRASNVLTVLQQPHPWHARAPHEHHCKEQCWQWDTTQRRRASAFPWPCSSSSNLNRGNKNHCREKVPSGWIGALSLETQHFPEKRAAGRVKKCDASLAGVNLYSLCDCQDFWLSWKSQCLVRM